MKKPILFYSTNLNAPKVTFCEALLKGLAPDKGLYMPEEIPQLSADEIDVFSDLEYYRIAYKIIGKFTQGEIDDDILKALVRDAYNFPVPLEKIVDNKHIMRLDQGPTASFKDFAARMMGRLINHLLSVQDRKLLILTATSGDTGSAIANAFYGLERTKVVVLFPKNEVTERQRKQMTTLGKNIQIISINGKFDDCQALVKEAFTDPDLNFLNMSSANSINIGRLVPQIVYYFYAFSRLGKESNDVIFSVPSGNFGDMMGGVFAREMGLPVKKFVISVNENDEFHQFLKTGNYRKIEPSINCLSSAMNVGHPSNLARLITLYGGLMDENGNISKPPDMIKMRHDFDVIAVSDITTKEVISLAYQKYRLLLEPHGAVGWKGLLEHINKNKIKLNQLCVSLETAHPAKFPEPIREILGFDPELPESLKGLENKDELYDELPANYLDFKNYLKNRY